MLEYDEREYLRHFYNEERFKKEFLRAIQELIDEEDAQTKSQNQTMRQQMMNQMMQNQDFMQDMMNNNQMMDMMNP